MPMLEVIHAGSNPLSLTQKRGFTEEVETILREVIGTPNGRMQLVFFELGEHDHAAGLRENQAM